MTAISSVSTAPRRHVRARLLSSEEVAPHHFRFRLESSEIAQGAHAGQFVHVLPAPSAFEWGFDPLLRRAFSILSTDRQSTFDVLFRALGKGTGALSRRRVGETIDLLGPLGIPFDLSAFHVKQSRRAILVGGGVGVPPMIFLAQTLRETGIEAQAIIGARGASDVIGPSDFAAMNVPAHITTEDGSVGTRGRVTDVLGPILEKQSENLTVFTCGPLPMLRAVAAICEPLAVPCQVSMEENMPCGIGVCNGCVVKVKSDDKSPYAHYRRMCVEGPVCEAREVDWS